LVPLSGFGFIDGQARAILVTPTKTELCIGIALVGSKPAPLHGFCRISNNSLALAVTASKIVLCGRIPLAGSKPVPFERFREISSDTFSLLVAVTKTKLRGSIALVGGEPAPLHGFSRISSNALAGTEAPAKHWHGWPEVLGGKRLQRPDGLGRVGIVPDAVEMTERDAETGKHIPWLATRNEHRKGPCTGAVIWNLVCASTSTLCLVGRQQQHSHWVVMLAPQSHQS
jgi:hypothetical protein